MGGKLGKNIKVFNPSLMAASSAHLSGPSHPPEIIMDDLGSEIMSEFTLAFDCDFLDPIIPTFISKNNTTSNTKKSRLRHHFRSFLGCFSCSQKNNIDYQGFKKWKKDANKAKTDEIAGIIAFYIKNHYDFITTAPPSKYRNLSNYCCFKLCEALSVLTDIPFIISFQQRDYKSKHGRFASLTAEMPLLVPGWNHKNQSILFIDDFITSGMTAKNCYNVLRQYDNHVDGLIYCNWGN